MQKEEGIISIFNNPHICRADRDTSLALHQEDVKQTKQGYITSTDNTLPT